MNDKNTIWVKAYTPQGMQVGITIGFEAGNLLSAADVDAMIADAGYSITLPGAKPGEEIEDLTLVMRRTQHNKDGTTSPCLGFYHSFDGLKFPYIKEWLDSPEAIAEMESIMGVSLDSMPVYPGDNFPLRDSQGAQAFLVTLPSPVQIATIKEAYTKEDGSTGKKVASYRFLGGTPSPQDSSSAPSNITDITESVEWLTNQKALADVKAHLGLLEMDNGKAAVETAREIVGKAGNYKTPKDYMAALDSAIAKDTA